MLNIPVELTIKSQKAICGAVAFIKQSRIVFWQKWRHIKKIKSFLEMPFSNNWTSEQTLGLTDKDQNRIKHE